MTILSSVRLLDPKTFIESLPSSPHVSWRLGGDQDIEFIWGMLANYGPQYAHDLLDVDPNLAYDMVKNNQVFVFTYDGYPVGMVVIDNVVFGLRCDVHLLITPIFIRPLLKAKAPERILYYLFDRLELRKVKAHCLESNKQTYKWLMRFGFHEKCRLPDETTVAGIPATMVYCELSRRYLLEKFLPVAGPDTHWRRSKRQSLSESSGAKHDATRKR